MTVVSVSPHRRAALARIQQIHGAFMIGMGLVIVALLLAPWIQHFVGKGAWLAVAGALCLLVQGSFEWLDGSAAHTLAVWDDINTQARGNHATSAPRANRKAPAPDAAT